MTAKRSLVSVVDDDESVRESLPDLLRQFGFAAAGVRVRRGVSRVGRLSADRLPGPRRRNARHVGTRPATGTDAAAAERFRSSSSPRTGDQTIRPRLLALGAVECLSKPFSETALLDALNAALRRGKHGNDVHRNVVRGALYCDVRRPQLARTRSSPCRTPRRLSSSLTTTSPCANRWSCSSDRRVAARNLCVSTGIPVSSPSHGSVLPGARRDASGPERPGAAGAACRADGHADHLHHRPRRRAHDRASHEGRSGRVPDEAVQGRRAAGRHSRCHRAESRRSAPGVRDASAAELLCSHSRRANAR